LLASFAISAQVKIGTNVTNLGASSMLEIESSDKGLLIPRVTSPSVIDNPINGMLIFDTTLQCVRGFANGVWTACGLATATPCSSPALTSITGASTIAPGGSATFTTTGSFYTSVVWSVTNSSNVAIYSGNGLTTGSLSFPSAGSYTISFTATNAPATGCSPTSITVSAVETVVIPSCTAPTLTAVSGTGSITPGSSATFTTTGSNYTSLVWNVTNSSNAVVFSGTGLTTGALNFTTADTYKVTFTATNATAGCTATNVSVIGTEIVSSCTLVAPMSSIVQPTCANGKIGSITITAQTGAQYSINGGSSYQTSNVFSNLAPGNYTLKVRNASNTSCVSTNTTQTLTDPGSCICPAPSIAVSGPASITYNTTGTFSLSGSNYTSVTWEITSGGVVVSSGSGASTGAINVGTVRAYTITFTAINASTGCTVSSSTATMNFNVTSPSGCSGLTSCSSGGVTRNVGITAAQSSTPGYSFVCLSGKGYASVRYTLNNGATWQTVNGLDPNTCYGSISPTIVLQTNQGSSIGQWTMEVLTGCGTTETRSGTYSVTASPNF